MLSIPHLVCCRHPGEEAEPQSKPRTETDSQPMLSPSASALDSPSSSSLSSLPPDDSFYDGIIDTSRPSTGGVVPRSDPLGVDPESTDLPDESVMFMQMMQAMMNQGASSTAGASSSSAAAPTMPNLAGMAALLQQQQGQHPGAGNSIPTMNMIEPLLQAAATFMNPKPPQYSLLFRCVLACLLLVALMAVHLDMWNAFNAGILITVYLTLASSSLWMLHNREKTQDSSLQNAIMLFRFGKWVAGDLCMIIVGEMVLLQTRLLLLETM